MRCGAWTPSHIAVSPPSESPQTCARSAPAASSTASASRPSRSIVYSPAGAPELPVAARVVADHAKHAREGSDLGRPEIRRGAERVREQQDRGPGRAAHRVRQRTAVHVDFGQVRGGDGHPEPANSQGAARLRACMACASARQAGHYTSARRTSSKHPLRCETARGRLSSHRGSAVFNAKRVSQCETVIDILAQQAHP